VIDEAAPGRSVVAIGQAFECALFDRIRDPVLREEVSFHLAEIVFDAYSLRELVAGVMEGRTLSVSEFDQLVYAVCGHIPYHQRALRKVVKVIGVEGG